MELNLDILEFRTTLKNVTKVEQVQAIYNNMKIKRDNLYSDIKESIDKHFDFLKDYGFSKFEEKEHSNQQNFETKNDFVSINISFQVIVSTYISATINKYYIGHLELKNLKIEEYRAELKKNYDHLWKQYVNTRNSTSWNNLLKQYAVNGKEINDKYLQELSEILKRHISTLNGDLELLKSNTETFVKEYEFNEEQNKTAERVRNGTYTLECPLGSREFNSIKKLKEFLANESEIKIYRVFDCNMKEIVLGV